MKIQICSKLQPEYNIETELCEFKDRTEIWDHIYSVSNGKCRTNILFSDSIEEQLQDSENNNLPIDLGEYIVDYDESGDLFLGYIIGLLKRPYYKWNISEGALSRMETVDLS